MGRYIGASIVEATPMKRIDYNKFRGWTIPTDENPLDDGYLVEAVRGHMTWIPKSVFESSYRKSKGPYKELKHDLLTNKYTIVFHEENYNFNAPHNFEVYEFGGDKLVGNVRFQEGPIKEHGVNGVMDEDLIAMVITRLEHFNRTDFSCRENAMAITKLEEALLWLGKRTMGRETRGVEGTHTV